MLGWLSRATLRPGILRSRLRSSSWRRRGLALAILAGGLALGYFGWFRDSSLVAVQNVKVEGVTTADRGRIVAALTDAAHGMSTLDVQPDRLASAVRGFPTVASVSANPSFPHGLTIRVTQRQPVLIAVDGNRQVPVAADGSLLPGIKANTSRLPQLHADSLPASGRLRGDPLQEALAAGAAPTPLRPLISQTSMTGAYGVVLTLRGGIELRFGTGARAAAKWAAVAAILADRRLTSLSYVDVRVPIRPAVGG